MDSRQCELHLRFSTCSFEIVSECIAEKVGVYVNSSDSLLCNKPQNAKLKIRITGHSSRVYRLPGWHSVWSLLAHASEVEAEKVKKALL